MTREQQKMGVIREVATATELLLEPEHSVGRASNSALRIRESYISAHHALLRWAGRHWEIRDLGSRNGTFVDGERVPAGGERELRRGANLAFGKTDVKWELVDDTKPAVMAVPLEGGLPILMEGDFLAIPSNEEPQATIYRTTAGWVVELPNESITPIANQQTIRVRGKPWKFCFAEEDTTRTEHLNAEMEMRHVHLFFAVSKDEEHVQIQLTCGGQSLEIATRDRNFLLLTLARRRLADAAEGLSEAACGWIYQEDLEHDPAMAAQQLNVDVFRLRKQFASLGVADAANIIERRPRTRQIRIGTGRLAIAEI